MIQRKSIKSGLFVKSKWIHSLSDGVSSLCSILSWQFANVKRVNTIINTAEKTAATKYALSRFELKYGNQAAKATKAAGIAPIIKCGIGNSKADKSKNSQCHLHSI